MSGSETCFDANSSAAARVFIPATSLFSIARASESDPRSVLTNPPPILNISQPFFFTILSHFPRNAIIIPILYFSHIIEVFKKVVCIILVVIEQIVVIRAAKGENGAFHQTLQPFHAFLESFNHIPRYRPGGSRDRSLQHGKIRAQR